MTTSMVIAVLIDTLTARLNARRLTGAHRLYTLTELMRTFRLNPLAVRRWQDRGLIKKVRVSPSGYVVDEDALRRRCLREEATRR